MTERRLVSVMFVDLVGFTAASERRDAEEVRELLTRYFDAARHTVGQYGGVVEKFIGDAVMAVWGTPLAHENDAERAVRAAMDILAAVPTLAPALQARAGVVTGGVAATLDAVGQGMVAGDAVNTASRVQSAAAPGEVLVDEATWRLTESAIAYAEAGEHVVKGKAQPLVLHRALRVVANVGGGERSATLEPAFVGRDREMRLVKDLFTTLLDERRARLVAVTGSAGMGKSRLAWEFEKYVDGIAVEVLWHVGRAVKYGEGVAYWALAEVVRGRFEVTEQEPADRVARKVAAGLQRYVTDEEERAWLLPRLTHLLGVGEGIVYPREDLFPAWRLLLERLSQTLPVVMVLEDLEQADAGLLDFLDYLLEWSAEFPIFVLALARPELAEHRPRWGRGGSSTTPIYLEPLSGLAMNELVDSLVPGVSEELCGRLVEHAEGVPLYAVEIVRMLLDRDVLIRAGGGYEVTRPLDRLDVPVSLQALIGARLDALSADERRLLQDASVLGTSFHRAGVEALTGLEPARLDEVLAGLLRKEMLRVRSDPLSPERGQYAFVQGLVRTVAYDRFSKKERKSRHVLVAEYLEKAWAGSGEIAEVIASHYFEAFTTAPADTDAEELRHKALETLVRAADRAASLAAPGEARHWYERAADLCSDDRDRRDFLERAGQMAMQDSEMMPAIAHFEAALAARDVSADPSAGRTLALLGGALIYLGHPDQALERMQGSYALLRDAPFRHPSLASLANQIANALFFLGRNDEASDPNAIAIGVATAFDEIDVLCDALVNRAHMASARDSRHEARALYEYAHELSLERDLPVSALRAASALLTELGCWDEAFHPGYEEAIALARRIGHRRWELGLVDSSADRRVLTGDWDELLRLETQHFPAPQDLEFWGADVIGGAAVICALRGDPAAAEQRTDRLRPLMASTDVQSRIQAVSHLAAVHVARGQLASAWNEVEGFVEGDAIPFQFQLRLLWPPAAEAALSVSKQAAEQVIAVLADRPPGHVPPYLHAQLRRHQVLYEIRYGEPDVAEVDVAFQAVIGAFRQLGYPFWLARSLLDAGEWFAGQDRREQAEPMLAEAERIFRELQAAPWVTRTTRFLPDR